MVQCPIYPCVSAHLILYQLAKCYFVSCHFHFQNIANLKIINELLETENRNKIAKDTGRPQQTISRFKQGHYQSKI